MKLLEFCGRRNKFIYLHTVYIQEHPSQTRILRVFKPAPTLKASLKSKCSTLPSIKIRIKCLVVHTSDYGPNKLKCTSNQKHQSTNKQIVNDRPSLIGNNNIDQLFITLIWYIDKTCEKQQSLGLHIVKYQD